MSCRLTVLFICFTSLVSGCLVPPENDPVIDQLQHGNMTLSQEIEAAKGNLRAIEADQAELNREIMGLGKKDADIEADIRELSNRLDNLEKQLQELDAARVRDKKEIIDKLTDQIAAMVNKLQASSASSDSTYSGFGRVHVVKKGQTLSQIAQAYGVNINVLIKVNKLNNPNALREGQELIIPE
jgi:LysM repeat protein